MGVIDIIIVCCFLPVLYFGIKNGLVKQLVAFAVIYFGITLSLRFATPVAEWITERLQISEFWAKTVSFIFIFFVVALVLSLLGKIVEKIIKISMLGWLNKLLGIAMTFCIFALLISVLVYFVDSANNLLDFIPKEKLEESRFYPLLLDLSKEVFPHFKELFQQANI
ncbi:MAG: CvpA family protein [Bacteroidales bacterium]|nr:CvpA family protein [Bacteroidales bacterium]